MYYLLEGIPSQNDARYFDTTFFIYQSFFMVMIKKCYAQLKPGKSLYKEYKVIKLQIKLRKVSILTGNALEHIYV